VLAVWHEKKCGILCAILIISTWTISVLGGATCAACALILWLIRGRIDERGAVVIRWLAFALATVIVAWAIKTSGMAHGSPSPRSSGEPWPMARARDILGMKVLAVMIVGSFAYWIRANRSVLVLAGACAALLTVSACIAPGTFADRSRDGNPAEIKEFSDWRLAIPPDANVFVVPAHNSAAFAWFTLQRPSYLTVDQSSGVVFSRATALEVRRRSQVLLPLMDPDWRLLSSMQRARSGKSTPSSSYRPLTRRLLIRLCSDPLLNFVVAREDIDLDPIRHTNSGNWKDWNLYDCRRVNSALPRA